MPAGLGDGDDAEVDDAADVGPRGEKGAEVKEATSDGSCGKRDSEDKEAVMMSRNDTNCGTASPSGGGCSPKAVNDGRTRSSVPSHFP